MTKPKATAPYVPGDRVRALLMDREGFTCLAAATVDRVTPLADGRTWRIGAARPGKPAPRPQAGLPPCRVDRRRGWS